VAALVYVYDHHARDLPKRLTQEFHDHHDLSQATLHVHLDEASCLEVTVLKGRGAEVQSFANHVIAERGVRHGHVVYVPITGDMTHSHAHSLAHSLARSHGHDRTHNHNHARGEPRTRVRRRVS
jgi:CopG family nickel-responsive transcriptional regulator